MRATGNYRAVCAGRDQETEPIGSLALTVNHNFRNRISKKKYIQNDYYAISLYNITQKSQIMLAVLNFD